MNELDVSRMLLMFEQSVREINKEEINPKIPELKLEDLHPVIRMVARARAKYLNELMNIANITETDQLPSPEQIKKLELDSLLQINQKKCVLNPRCYSLHCLGVEYLAIL